MKRSVKILSVFLVFMFADVLSAQSLNFPTEEYGISFGNSRKFTGLRFNFSDRAVEEVNGLNFTLWRSRENEDSFVNGLSMGIWGPDAGTLNGVNLGAIGVVADHNINGFSVGAIGAGSGSNINGVTFGGLGAGAGGTINGLVFGGLGAGAGQNVNGIIIGGLGVGAGQDLTGIGIGLLGIGAGRDLTGIGIGGLGAGCGGKMQGLFVGGLGAGAPVVEGLILAGIGAGGNDVTGAVIALGTVRVEDGGRFTGFAFSTFNYIKGRQNGVSLGIVNYARSLKGLQIGILNYVADNPDPFKVLPLINFNL